MKTKMLFALLFLSCSAAMACMELPKKVRHTTASFNDEVFEVVNGQYGPQFKNGDSQIFFNYKKNRWCTSGKTASDPIQCFDTGTKFALKDSKNGQKVVGQAVISDKTFIIFSVDSDGQQSFTKPYLRISTDTVATKGSVVTEYQTTLTMESVNSNKQVDGVFAYDSKFGTYDEEGRFTKSGPTARNLGGAVEKIFSSDITLNGQSSSAVSGCGARVTSQPYGSAAQGKEAVGKGSN